MPRKSTMARKMSIQKRLHGMDQFQADAIDPERERMKRQYRWLKRFLPLFSPLGRVHQVWDLVSIFAIMYSVHVNLFEITWSSDNPDIAEKWRSISLTRLTGLELFTYLEMFLLGFFIVDVFFNFLTAFYDEDGVLVWDRVKIAMEYVKGWFWIDIIDLATNIYTITNPAGAASIPPIKLLRISKILRVLTRWVMLGYDPHKLQIFKMFILLVTVGNLLACAWYKAAQYDSHSEDSWTSLYLPEELQVPVTTPSPTPVDEDGCAGDYDSDEWHTTCDSMKVWSQYLSAAYFSFATLTTVGYGDISAHTNNERILALIALMIGNAIFAAIIGTMASLFNKEDVKETLYQSRLQEINGFMKHHRLPPELRQRIRDYFELGHRVHVEDEQMKQWIPSVLMREVMITIHADLCEVVPFLAEAGRTITGMLMENMHNLVYCAGEYIMVEAELVTAIKIIKAGHVQQINGFGKLVKTLPKGGYFGDECIKTLTCPSTWNYRAKDDVEILSIDQDYFELMLDAFPDFSLLFEELTESRREYDAEAAAKAEKNEKAMAKTGVVERPQTPPPGRKWRSKGSEPLVALKRSKTESGGFDESLKEAHENAIKEAIKAAIVEQGVGVETDEEGRTSFVTKQPSMVSEGDEEAAEAAERREAAKEAEIEEMARKKMLLAEEEAVKLAARMRAKEEAIESGSPAANSDEIAQAELRARTVSGGGAGSWSQRSGRTRLEKKESSMDWTGQEWDMSSDELQRQRALNLVERSGRRSSNISSRAIDMARKGSMQLYGSMGNGAATETRLAAIEKSVDELQQGTKTMMQKIMERLDSIDSRIAAPAAEKGSFTDGTLETRQDPVETL